MPNGPDFGDGTALWSGRGLRNLRDAFLTFRIDHIISDQDTIFGRYTMDDSKARLPFSSSEFPGFARSPQGIDHLVTVRHNHFFEPSFLNDLTLGFNRSDRSARLEDPNPGGLSFSIIPNAPFGSVRVGGLGLVGYSSRAIADLVQNVYQVSDVASLIRGRHSMKFGFEFRRFHINNNQEIDTNGIITFPNLRSLLLSRPIEFRGAAEGADFVRGYRYSQYAFYFQDKIDLTPSFSLNLGMRYEPWSNVKEVNGKLSILLDPLNASGPGDYQTVDRLLLNNPTLSNWAPRVGFAWDLNGDGTTSLRGGFGIFHDSPLNGSLLGPVTAAPPFVELLTVQDPGFPDILGSDSGPVTPDFSPWVLEYDNFNWPSIKQFNLSLQRAFFFRSLVTLTYSGSRGHHLLSRRELNSRIPVSLDDGRKFFPEDAERLNPNLGSVSLQATDSSSWYDSFQATWNRQFSREFTVLASYTFAKSIDEATPTMTLIETAGHPKMRMDSDRLSLDKGLSAFDVRHSFATSFLWNLPVEKPGSPLDVLLRDWQIGCFLNLASGHPFTPLISFNNSRSGVSGSTSRADRPNLKPGYNRNPKKGRADLWYDPNAFELPKPGFFGNLGRNTVIGPGYSNVDVSLSRNFLAGRVSEDFRVQFRAECFNLFNHANFDLPGNSGSVVAASYIFTDSSGEPNIGATRPLRTVSNSRQIQFGLKLVW
jgi:hypothetical protein